MNSDLSRSGDLTGRIQAAARALKGRIAFSTSLGIEDQAILHAIAASGVAVDVFTLDTGRLFPETIETIAVSELRYRIKIRVIAPDAGDVEFARRKRRRVRFSATRSRRERPAAMSARCSL